MLTVSAMTFADDGIVCATTNETAIQVPQSATNATYSSNMDNENILFSGASIEVTDTVTVPCCPKKAPNPESTQVVTTSTTIIAHSTCHKGVQTDVHSAIQSSKRVIPSLKNLFNKNGSLQWPNFAITDIEIGPFNIEKVISVDGSHGLVVSCSDSNGKAYAMKIERGDAEMSTDTIAFTDISTRLRDREDLRIPRLCQNFREESKEIMVMELLGPDLKMLNDAIGDGPMSPKTILQIGVSLLHAYEQIHETGWLHLTTKPINFCIGGSVDTRHKIYAVDFGRAQKYLVSDEKGIIHHRDQEPYIEAPQNLKYSSFWSHAEITSSRRDDLNSLAFMLLLLATPVKEHQKWGGPCFFDKWKFQLKFADGMKKTTLKPVGDMLLYTLDLKYDEKPDYSMLRESFESYAKEQGIMLDGKYDWDDKIYVDKNGRVILNENDESSLKDSNNEEDECEDDNDGE